MKLSEAQQRIQELLAHELPDANTLIADGHAIADDLQLGRSLFCQEMGVASEAEYKAQCVRDGVIMYHAHIGMGSWSATAEALRDGAILVVIVLFLFLLNFRTTFITLTAIPLSVLVTALVFHFLELSINVMTLGGIAVAVGVFVARANEIPVVVVVQIVGDAVAVGVVVLLRGSW